ncbi:MAG: TrkA family potassium uptake protein [Dehalococcoidia bacterium]|nr:TrkA family potassium uptake protein [Dehalococcoidia bacterium]
MKQQVAVIGLGRFGTAVARELVKAGHEVLGIDHNLDVVQELSADLSHVVQADAIDQDTLQRLGIEDFDTVIVGITEVLETSILATLIAKRLGVPRVIAKARNELHGEILERVGADRVVYPERDTGMRLAHAWSSMDITDSLDVVEGYIISRVMVPEGLVGRRLDEALRADEGVSLLLLVRGAHVIVYPSGDEVLATEDVLVLAGQTEALERFFSGIRPARART